MNPELFSLAQATEDAITPREQDGEDMSRQRNALRMLLDVICPKREVRLGRNKNAAVREMLRKAEKCS